MHQVFFDVCRCRRMLTVPKGAKLIYKSDSLIQITLPKAAAPVVEEVEVDMLAIHIEVDLCPTHLKRLL